MMVPLDNPATSKSWRLRRIVLGALGLGGTVLFAWLAVRNLNLGEIPFVLSSTRLLPWIPLAVLSYLAGHLVRGRRCKRLVAADARLGTLAASNIVVAGYAGNNVLPARLGELVRASMLAKRSGIPIAQALTVTVVERMFDGIAILFLLGAGSLLAAPAEWIHRLVEVGALVFGSALALVLLAVLAPRMLVAKVTRLSLPLGSRGQEALVRLVSTIANGVAPLRSVSALSQVLAMSLVVWILETGMFALAMPALGLPIRLGTAALAMAITNLAILIPSTPGFVGPFHFFCAQALISQGLSPAVALSYAVVVHLTFYVPITVWGAGVMLAQGVRAGAMAALVYGARRAQSTRTVAGRSVAVVAHLEPDRRAAAPSRFDLALAEAILPQATHRDLGVERSAAFLVHMIGELPPRLVFMYRCGMTAFAAFVLCRYGRRFQSLPLVRRRAAVQSWAFGRAGLLRQLFRPVRSTLLLAGYDQWSPTGSADVTAGPEARA